jgi:DNA-binding NarL/FixJ family response regulator
VSGFSTLSVFVVDDQELVRRGIVAVLERTPDLRVVGEAVDAREALIRMPLVKPDVAVLAGRLPDRTGSELCDALRSALPQTRCILLTAYHSDDAILGAVMAGAAGYLLREVAARDLVEAIRRVGTGDSLLDPGATARLLALLRGEDTNGGPNVRALSPREREILDLITDGKTNRQIGAHLFLAEKTVKNHVSHILAKLGLGSRTQAAVLGASIRRAPNEV